MCSATLSGSACSCRSWSGIVAYTCNTPTTISRSMARRALCTPTQTWRPRTLLYCGRLGVEHKEPLTQVKVSDTAAAPSHGNLGTIDDSTPVSQSRHTLRFQPIACRGIMRCPRVLTRPEMAWKAFVPDTTSGQLAVFDMAEKKPGKRNCCYGQCKSDERYLTNVQVSHSGRF